MYEIFQQPALTFFSQTSYYFRRFFILNFQLGRNFIGSISNKERGVDIEGMRDKLNKFIILPLFIIISL